MKQCAASCHHKNDLPSLFLFQQHIGKVHAQMEVLSEKYNSYFNLNHQITLFGLFEFSGVRGL